MKKVVHGPVLLESPSTARIVPDDFPSSSSLCSRTSTSPDLDVDPTSNPLSSDPSLGHSAEKNLRCRACHSEKLFTDYKQGDRVCTECGVVDEERILEEGPEWRDYNELEDIIRGTASGCRSSLIPTNDQLYLGGLQPTTLSKYIFGGNTGTSQATRKKLLSTNRKMDHMMEKIHSRAITSAELVHEIRKRGRTSNTQVSPEYTAMIEGNERASRRRLDTLNSDRWSLSRAIRLNGAAHEVTETLEEDDFLTPDMIHCSRQLYKAYSIITQTSNNLGLPLTIQNESISLLCAYAKRRNGLVVRGVASTLKKKNDSKIRPSEGEKQARDALREYNTSKQIGALAAAVLFLVARRMKHPRSPEEICKSIAPDVASRHLDCKSEPFIKKKHLSRGVSELKEFLPEQNFSFVSGMTNNGTLRLRPPVSLDEIGKRLMLPPVFDASIRIVSNFLLQQRGDSCSFHESTRLIPAASTLFLSTVGKTMKEFAEIAEKENEASKMQHGTCSKTDIALDHKNYQMNRVWDAWKDQIEWKRSVEEIADAYGVCPASVQAFAKSSIMPYRQKILDALRIEASNDEPGEGPLANTPLSGILLGRVEVVSESLKL